MGQDFAFRQWKWLYSELSHNASQIVMIANLAAIIGILTLGIPLLILIMLLPALIELRKPRDEGPRVIKDGVSEAQIQIMRMTPVANIESEQKFDSAIVQPLATIIGVLPNLEV